MPLGPPKQRAVLTILLLRANRVVSTDELIESLWPEKRPREPRTAVQGYVSDLRKVLELPGRGNVPDAVLVTEANGYSLRLEEDQVDLHRFERLFAVGREELQRGDAEQGEAMLSEALTLWRGSPLADFAYEDFAQSPIARLEELRLAAQEDLNEARLALGRHAELAGVLEELVAAHPARERLRGQLMLALYRSGRQAEALAVYQETRRALVDELGIEPTPALQGLERRILTQDSTLEAPQQAAEGRRKEEPRPQPERAVLVVATETADLEELSAFAEPLTSGQRPHELVLVYLLADPRRDAVALPDANERVRNLQSVLTGRGVVARTAAFTTSDPSADTLRLVSRPEVDLLLVVGPAALRRSGELDEPTRAVLNQAPCDVGIWSARTELGEDWRAGPVIVPFGASEHEWAALELGAWLAGTRETRLEVLGTAGDSETGQRDASRLLADASLLLQRGLGVSPDVQLVSPGHRGVLEASRDGGVIVVGLPDRWPTEGLGATRWSIVRSAKVPVVLVRSGLRPGGLAPDTSLTRYGWSAGPA